MKRIALSLAIPSLLIAIGLAIAASGPLAFQKFNTLQHRETIPPLASSVVDLDPLMASIPYENGKSEVLAVHPETKHRRTMLEGAGDCSEKSFGLAWQLVQEGTDFQVIHFLRRSGFDKGQGHTVVRLRYRHAGEERVGIVDLLDGGLPRSAEQPIQVSQVEAGPIPHFDFEALHPHATGRSGYYGEYLEDVAVGFIPAAEAERYFRFLERIYVPLGNEKLEKYLYDGIALLLGYLPRTSVPEYHWLTEGREADRARYGGALWSLRIGIATFPLLLAFELLRLASSARGGLGRRDGVERPRPVEATPR